MTANKQLQTASACTSSEEKSPFPRTLAEREPYLLGEELGEVNKLKWRGRQAGQQPQRQDTPALVPTSGPLATSELSLRRSVCLERESGCSRPRLCLHGGWRADWIVSPWIVSPQAALPKTGLSSQEPAPTLDAYFEPRRSEGSRNPEGSQHRVCHLLCTNASLPRIPQTLGI